MTTAGANPNTPLTIALKRAVVNIKSACLIHLNATRHLVCESCSNWVDFVKSDCEKSYAAVQADNFCFVCKGCAKMKGLEVELGRLRQLVLALVGREEVGCASGSGGGGAMDDKVGRR